MTRKDFQLIADALAAAGSALQLDEVQMTRAISVFNGALKTTNPRFDRVRFGQAVTAKYDALKGLSRPRELVGPQVGENEPQ